MKKKELKQLAEKIISLEQQFKKENNPILLKDIEDIAKNLTLTELIELDLEIQKNLTPEWSNVINHIW